MSTVLDLAIAISLTDRVSGATNNIIRQFGLMKNATDDVQRKMNALKSMAWTGGAFTAGGVLAFTAIATAAQEAVTHAGNLQEIMTSIKTQAFGKDLFDQSKTGMIESQMKEIKDLSTRLGLETTFSNLGAGEAILELQKGGVAYTDIINGAAEATVKFAQLNKMLPAVAAEAMVQTRAGFQLTGEEMLRSADIMTKVASASSASAEDINRGLGNMGGVASQMWGSRSKTEQVLDSSVLVALTRTQTPEGASAGTYVRNMLQRLVPQTKAQTEAMASAGWLDDAGKSVFLDYEKDPRGQLKSAQEIASILRKTVGGGSLLGDDKEISKQFEMANQGMGTDKLIKLFHKVFGEQGGRTAYTLLRTGEGSMEEIYKNFERQLSLNEQVALQMENFNQVLDTSKEAWVTFMTAIGTPLLGPATQFFKTLTDVIAGAAKFFEEHPQISKYMFAIAGGVTAFIAVSGAITIAVSAFSALSLALQMAGIGFGTLMAISGGVVLAIGAIAAVGYLIYSNWDKIKPYASAVWDYVSTTTTNAWNSIITAVGPAAREVWSIIQSAWSEIRRWTDENWDDISKTIGIVWQLIKNTIDTHITIISFIVGAAWDAITILTKTYWPVIKDTIKLNWDLTSGLLKVGMKLLQGDWGGAWEAVKDTASKVWNDIKSMFGSSFDAIQKGFINFQIVVGKGILLIIGNIQKLFPTLLTLVEAFDKVAGTNFAEEINRKISSVIANTKRELASLEQQKINIEVSAQIKDAKANYSGKEYMNIVKNYIDGSHYNGLYNVPYDNYLGLLHKDEMVLTKSQADSVRKGQSNSQVVKPPQRQSSIVIGNGGSLVSIGSVQQQPGENAEAFADRVARKAVAIMSRNSKMGRLTTGTTGGGFG
ncbi:phage tail tape measure protein [Brevibacillus porteri]|uniref:phage tail tape measure protein n=1 Tax=Brevibacillus porteri TaxID=2126350 RepID=UPI003D24AC2C